jgi:hypothetical protein
MEIQGWIYKGKVIKEAPKDFYGFIYCIVDDKGKRYWGKKAFEHNKKTKLSKKARKATGKRIVRTKVDSGWQDYWGSSKFLIEYLEEVPSRKNKCIREIIKLCKDKASLSYWEMVTLVNYNVLFREDCWNGNILGKFFKGKIHE